MTLDTGRLFAASASKESDTAEAWEANNGSNNRSGAVHKASLRVLRLAIAA
eukprot:CAMPEP_0115638474 /NCGR_PEP_ID=MMETSP0272-20121206/34746_1 /TAXON_ID=71861 /ORGANISM="Scrippsiella trochoidea, Strain CCMP3099" /LENGTH=50 /DNA_ID=CAMNT_0003075597 /DNA_START=102 /DNA_END=250 /DNA_ORIENTATION=-